MSANWQTMFRHRMRRFEARRPPRIGEISVSIKVRVVSGCFHREHPLRAYELIDQHLAGLESADALFEVEEHESGPEILVYLAVATAGITLVKSVIDLITATIKARSDGIKKGDKPSDPVELTIRRVGNREEFHEQIVLRIGHTDPIDPATIEKRLNKALHQVINTDERKDG